MVGSSSHLSFCLTPWRCCRLHMLCPVISPLHRMRVSLPNPLLLFYDHALPHLSRRASTSEPPPSPPAGLAASSSQGAAGASSSAAAAAVAVAGSASARSLASPGGSAGGSPEGSPAVAGAAAAADSLAPSGGPAPAGLQPSGSGRLGRLLLRMHLRRQPPRPKLLRQQQTVPIDQVRASATQARVWCRCAGRRVVGLEELGRQLAGPCAAQGPALQTRPCSPPCPLVAQLLQVVAAEPSVAHPCIPCLPACSPQLLQPVVLQNKAPHWNEGLRCWCLNFRGRVKLASVKNFQVRLCACEDPSAVCVAGVCGWRLPRYAWGCFTPARGVCVLTTLAGNVGVPSFPLCLAAGEGGRPSRARGPAVCRFYVLLTWALFPSRVDCSWCGRGILPSAWSCSLARPSRTPSSLTSTPWVSGGCLVVALHVAAPCGLLARTFSRRGTGEGDAGRWVAASLGRLPPPACTSRPSRPTWCPLPT